MEFSLLTSHEGRAIPKLVAEEKIGNVSKEINDYKNYCFSPFNYKKINTSLYTALANLECRKPRIKTIIFISVTFKRMFLLTQPHHNYFVVVDATVITYFFIKLDNLLNDCQNYTIIITMLSD